MTEITKLSVGQRSRQRYGRLTPAQTRDKRHREAIAASMSGAGPQTHWYCLQLPRDKLLFYGSLLAADGLCIGLPERRKKVLVNGFVKKGRYRYERPFTGYMFMGVNPGVKGLYALYSLRILWSIVGENGGVHIFDPQAISRLYERLDCGEFDGFIEDTPFQPVFEAGDNVRISFGAYQGQVVKIDGFSGKFADITGVIFGGEHKMQVPISTLERV